jgi:hypothetical protein
LKLSADRLAALISATLENEFISDRAQELAQRLRATDPIERAVDSILAG